MHVYTTRNFLEMKIDKPRKTHSLEIKSIWWYPNNNKFITTGADGMVYEWLLHQNDLIRCKIVTKVLNISPGGEVNDAFAVKKGSIYCTTTTKKLYRIANIDI